MGNAIGRVLTDSWMANHDRRVRAWLDHATEESVLETLTSSFFPGGEGYGGLHIIRGKEAHIKSTFDAYGSIDEIHKTRYWYEKDFRLFLSSRFPGPILKASIPILWRSFNYHGYFPFRQELQRLDYSAFRRAIGLLVAEGNRQLGMDAHGRDMDDGRYLSEDFRASSRLRLTFRSLSVLPFRTSGPGLPKSKENEISTAEEDILDVLLLVQPCDPCLMSISREEMLPHAQRIGSSTRHTDSPIPREDFLNLLKLLLSVQMDPPKRFGSFQTAHSMPETDINVLNEVAGALLRRFVPDEKSDIDWPIFKSVLDTYLPKFPFQLRLIFTAFLIPSTNQSLDTSQSTSILPGPYAQDISLCLHPSLAESGQYHAGTAYLEACFALQKTRAIYTASPSTFNCADLVATVMPIKTATLLLVTGEVITADDASYPIHDPSGPVVFGALIPTSWDLQRRREYKANPTVGWHTYAPAHMLFQLEPRLEILRPGTDAWLMDLITIVDTNTEQAQRGGLRFGAEGASGLSVDFNTGIAGIRSVDATGDTEANKESQRTHENGQAQGSTYQDVGAGGNMNAGGWKSSVKIRKLEIYDLGGPVLDPFSEEETATDEYEQRLVSKVSTLQVDERYNDAGLKSSQPQVGEAELRKRIEGFGSSG